MAALNRVFSGRRLALWAGACAALGAFGLALGFQAAPARTLFAYLVAFAYCASLSVGALFVLMIGYAANAAWMSVIRRLCEAVALGVAPLLLLFAPLALGLGRLYVWVDPPATLPAETRALILHKQPYLNPSFFLLRTLAYFAIWIASAALLRRWSRARERPHLVGGSEHEPLARERRFSSAMLVWVALATTFAAFDWLMSLTPTWFSTMFGVYYFAGGFLAALALVSMLAHWTRAGLLRDVLTGHHFHALGRLLFAFTIFWAYVAYFQAFLISIADKPSEVTFYLARLQGSWRTLTYLLCIGHFVVPFFLLLPRQVKSSSAYVAALSGWLLIMHWLDVYWLVMPVHSHLGVSVSWLDAAALLAVGGATLACCAVFQTGVPVLASGDPLLEQGSRYASNQ